MNKVFDGYERSVKKSEIGNAEFFRQARIKMQANPVLCPQDVIYSVVP